eukprot:gb/GEZJ01005675.1/.p1 GENE.gb/GEZJ01005675.1/~~gb/GEZJ01005675.1/.p1  ORF type:complete len:140 (-),score=2.17 gb/GEZJ01005675.1/:231-650(-)
MPVAKCGLISETNVPRGRTKTLVSDNAASRRRGRQCSNKDAQKVGFTGTSSAGQRYSRTCWLLLTQRSRTLVWHDSTAERRDNTRVAALDLDVHGNARRSPIAFVLTCRDLRPLEEGLTFRVKAKERDTCLKRRNTRHC